jgi:hypothetical protein
MKSQKQLLKEQQRKEKRQLKMAESPVKGYDLDYIFSKP